MPDQREVDRAAVISAMSRAKQNEAAQATMLVRKALSPTKPISLLSSSSVRQSALTQNENTIASSCPSNLSIIERPPDVVLDTTVINNTLSIEETDTS
jgi:hypothetical protein